LEALPQPATICRNALLDAKWVPLLPAGLVEYRNKTWGGGGRKTKAEGIHKVCALKKKTKSLLTVRVWIASAGKKPLG
jgi:hypothetical protein